MDIHGTSRRLACHPAYMVTVARLPWHLWSVAQWRHQRIIGDTNLRESLTGQWK